MSEEEEPAQLSDVAQEALRKVEEKAAEKRQKHLAEDAKIKMHAAAGPSETSSGIRISPSGGPGVPPVMPGATTAPVPVSLAPPSPELVNAAEMLAPANAQQEARAEAGRAAFALVEKQRAATVAQHAEVTRNVMWYVRCGICGGPGIWVSTRGVIGPEDWWSNYKPRGVPWPSKDIWCQCCWALNSAQNPLKILHTTIKGKVISVTPYARMLVEIDVEEYARLIAVPEPEKATPDG